MPPLVWAEVRNPSRPGAASLGAASWIRVVPVTPTTLLASLSLEVDPGEAEAIALALELHADALLIDERQARRTAARLGVPITGVLGVLLEAKRNGLLAQVRPVVDAMIGAVGFRINRRSTMRSSARPESSRATLNPG